MNNEVKEFWENEFGDSEIGYDFAGREIRKCAYGQENSRFGWNIDHILPKSTCGTDHKNNLQITHMETNAERSNKTTFWIDNVLYQVKKVSQVYDDDIVANYCNYYEGKKYCIVIVKKMEDNFYRGFT